MVGRVAGGTVVALVALAGAARAQVKPEALPPGVTAQMVREGETLFKGAGLCSACHGQDGKGIPTWEPTWLTPNGSRAKAATTRSSGRSPPASPPISPPPAS